MILKKALLACGLMLVLSVGFVASPVFGGIEPPLPGSEKIVGPAMWAVGVVFNCGGSAVGTLRVKKIEGCDIDTDPQQVTDLNCPTVASDALWYRLEQNSVFSADIPAICQPIITKVKNFKNDTTDPTNPIVSFDAQIKFVVPTGQPDDVCEQ